MTDVNPAIDRQIALVNQRLKLAQMGLQIERRGEKLNLRGTLPPRPNSGRSKPYQQRLSLHLPATKIGLKQAERQAKVVAAELIQESFTWSKYLPTEKANPLDLGGLTANLQSFEQQFFDQPKRSHHPSSTQTTWDTAYAPYFRKLATIASNQPSLSLEQAFYTTIQSTPENSRSRQACCTALGKLAKFLDLPLPIDLKQFWGSYGTSRTQFRELPSDELILATYHRIPNPHWQFVYGIMATYGLRNHEVFFCDYTMLRQGDPEAAIRVLETTKTGSHEVWPFYPEWVEQFQLRDLRLPAVTNDLNQTTLRRIGQQVTNQFRRYDLPFSPYDLRHAWAVRTIHFGLPDVVAARMMGHSVTIHNRTYHQWITRRDQQQAVQAALSRSRLPAPQFPENLASP